MMEGCANSTMCVCVCTRANQDAQVEKTSQTNGNTAALSYHPWSYLPMVNHTLKIVSRTARNEDILRVRAIHLHDFLCSVRL